MTGGPLDGPIELARLVRPGELEELVEAVRRALGGELAVYDPKGHLLAGAAAAGPPGSDLHHDGERIGMLAASGPQANGALTLLADTLGLLVHHARARELAAMTHEEAMRMTFGELTEHNLRLQRAVARLEELDRLKSNFLATMSHELRTPLTSVIGYAEMMAEGLAGSISTEQGDYLATILSKADQLLGLITAVLDVATLESAPLALERNAISLTEIVASEVAQLSPQADKRGIAIHIEARGDSVVLGDRKKIRQVVSSLLSNAVKFTPDRGHVGVALRPGPLSPGEADSRHAVQLVVSDSGIGISRDQVAKIFEPFFQVDSSSTRAFGGTGLGLTLAKAYVEAHGGRIWVDTTPGQGSTFTATFPLRVGEPRTDAADEQLRGALVTLGHLDVAIPLAVLCVIVSGFFSGTEVALFTLRRVDREQLKDSDRYIDHRILKLLERPRRLISTVLIGHETFDSILAILALAVMFRLYPSASEWALGGLALAITLPLIVLISEVTAKTLAAKAPLAWARVCAIPLSLFAVLVTPIRVIIAFASEILLRPLGDAARTRPTRDLSEQEFRSLVDAGSAQGQVDARERRLIHRVFEFSDKKVGEVMTPRDRIFALSYDLPMQRLVKEIAARGFSRVPIYQKSLDNVRGIINAKDLVRAAAGQPLGRPLNDLLHEPLFVPRTTPVKRLFLKFKQKKVHMAIVVSEYGKVLGLVTMDDLLSQIFGVLRDERADLQQSMPNMKRARTPAVGVPEVGAPPVETSPVPRDELHDMQSVPVHEHAQPVLLPTPQDGGIPRLESAEEADDRQRAAPTRATVEELDDLARATGNPPIRPIHPVDEVTPPAIDIEELERSRGKPL